MQSNNTEVAQTLYAMLSYPSWKDFKWGDSEQPNQGLSRNGPRCRCPQDLGEDHCGIKRKDHAEQTQPSGKGFVKFPVELLKLHKEVFLTAHIVFVNKIPFS
jgi:hypothetical protein